MAASIAKIALGAVLLVSGADAFAPTLSTMGTHPISTVLKQVCGALEAWISDGLAA
jgi:hypothetical protein